MSHWVIRESLIFLQKLVKILTKKDLSVQQAQQTQPSLRRSNPGSYFDISLRGSFSKKNANDSFGKTQSIKVAHKPHYLGIFKIAIGMLEAYLVFLAQKMLKQKDTHPNGDFQQISETLLTHLQSFGKQIQSSDKFTLGLDHRKFSQMNSTEKGKENGSLEERKNLGNLRNELISKIGLVARVLKLGSANSSN